MAPNVSGGDQTLPSGDAAPHSSSGLPFARLVSPTVAQGPLTDRYQLLTEKDGQAELGRGQYGVVRRCLDSVTGKMYACKTIDKTAMISKSRVLDIYMEIYCLHVLKWHPHLARAVSVHEDEESVHMVMELCSGGDLYDLVRRRRRLREGEAITVFRSLCQAVHHLHSNNIVHMDIKPENILLTVDSPASQEPPTLSPASKQPNKLKQQLTRADEDGATEHSSEPWKVVSSSVASNGGVGNAGAAPLGPPTLQRMAVKLSDFGQAVILAPGEKAQGLAGSVYYMAPEVVAGMEYDFAADVWSLGIVLYVLLSGSVPFFAASPREILPLITTRSPSFSSSVWSRVSPDAVSLIRWMLSVDPLDRPTIEQVLEHPWLKPRAVPTHSYTDIHTQQLQYLRSRTPPKQQHQHQQQQQQGNASPAAERAAAVTARAVYPL